MNTASIYDSAIAGLQYAQAGMVATSQNVTGSNVAGYVRRNPDLQISSLSPSSIEPGGTAFSVEGFTRNFNALLQGQLLSQQSKTSYTATLTQAVATLDATLVDPSASIATALANFFNAAGSLANDPANQAYQQALAGAANQVGDRIRGLADVVGNLENDARQGLADVLNQANTLAPQLADINVKIRNATVPGVSFPSGDLLDERDRITSKLQELIGGTTTINEDGTASYSLNGLQLVDRQSFNQFTNSSHTTPVTADAFPWGVQLRVNSPRNQPSVYTPLGSPETVQTQNGQPVVVPASAPPFKDGQAGAYFLLVQNFVPTLQKSLNLLAVELVHRVNDVTGSSSPIFGFQRTDGVSGYVSDLAAVDTLGQSIAVTTPVNPNSMAALVNSPGFDTFQELVDGATPGSSTYSRTVSSVALAFDARRFTAVIASAPTLTATTANSLEGLRTTFTQPVTFITSSVANTIATWSNNHKTNVAMSQVLSDQKNAISGVNLDEEAANLVKYQQLYNASSKLIQTNRQMFDTLLAMLSGN